MVWDTNLAALEGRPASRTEASPLVVVQYFTKDCDHKVMVKLGRAEELGDKAVRRPGVGHPVEVGHEVKLGE